MNACYDCGKDSKHDDRAWYCNGCYYIRNRFQSVAIKAVRAAVRSGQLPKIGPDTKCVDCGKPARDYDHRDYSKPLAVEPVCRSCNLKRGPGLLPRVA